MKRHALSLGLTRATALALVMSSGCLPNPEEVDAGPSADAGVVDAGVADAGGADAGVVDAGVVDAGVVDAGVADAGVADAGSTDAGIDAGWVVQRFDGGPSEYADGIFDFGPPMLAARGDAFVVPLLDGRVLIAGGSGPGFGPLLSAELLSPLADGGGVSVATASMAATHASGAAIRLRDGRVLFAGGTSTLAELFDPLANNGSGAFVPTGSLSVVRSRPLVAMLPDGRVLVAGGYSNASSASSALVTAEAFDPAAAGGVGGFVPLQSMQVARGSAAATVLDSGSVLVVGGLNAAGVVVAVERFDPPTDGGLGSFSGLGDLQLGSTQPQTVLRPDGKVFVTGYSNAAYFDPEDGGATFTPLPTDVNSPSLIPLLDGRVLLFDGNSGATLHADGGFEFVPVQPTTARRGATPALLADGRVLIAGGGTGGFPCGNALASTEVYLPDVRVRSIHRALPALRTPRVLAALVPLADGRALAVGGDQTVEFFTPDPDGGPGAFVRGANLSGTATGGGAALLDGTVLFVGGAFSDTVELFDPRAGGGLGASVGRWPLPRPNVTEVGAVTLRDGRVLLAGGYFGGPGSIEASASIFDRTLDAGVSPLADMAHRRRRHTMILLRNGKVLIVGGGDSANSHPDELFDPDAGFTSVPGSDHPDATAQLLPDGRVLILSRGPGCGARPGVAEIFDPTTTTSVTIGVPPVDVYAAAMLGRSVLLLGSRRAALYEPALDGGSGSFTLTASPVGSPRLAPLADGRVLVLDNVYPPTGAAWYFWP